MARVDHRDRARPQRDAGGGGAARRAARPRLLRHIALGQSQVLGLLARRLGAAADGDFVIALYNPASQARPERVFEAFALLRQRKSPTTPVAFARAIGRPDERIVLSDARRGRSGSGRHEHARAHRFERDAVRRARGGAAVAADAALLRGGAMSLDPRQRVGEPRRLGDRRGRTSHHDHGNAEDARRLDLGVGRFAAAVLADQDLDDSARISASSSASGNGPRDRIRRWSGRASMSAGRSIARTR